MVCKPLQQVSPELWPVLKHWSQRVENSAHTDRLGGIYSRMLEQNFKAGLQATQTIERRDLSVRAVLRQLPKDQRPQKI